MKHSYVEASIKKKNKWKLEEDQGSTGRSGKYMIKGKSFY